MNPVAVGRFRPATPGGRPVNWAATGRLGGVSSGEFAELNLSFTVGDDSSRVDENRRLAGRLVGVEQCNVLDAKHGALVQFVTEPGISAATDAVVTTVVGLGLMALAADCVPIVLADPDAGVIAAVHCGWRGLGLGVVPAAVDVMREHGATRIKAVTGPAICVDCYPVGLDCISDLRMQLGREVLQECAIDRGDQWRVDVRAGVHAQLRLESVATWAIERCTATDPQLFSYRANGRTGRQGMIVAL
ncbi:MAG: polyphenol oxidase family protein [Actinomycetota bacterium]|nr:polyphenol oxidase family protein [Actinomycetota bacterium]